MKLPHLETLLAAVLLYLGISRVWTSIADHPWRPWTWTIGGTPLRVNPALAGWLSFLDGIPATVAFFVVAYALLARRRWASTAYLFLAASFALDIGSFLYIGGADALSEASIGLTLVIAPFVYLGWRISRRLDSKQSNAL